MNTFFKKAQQGFTLIEILVVIGIIAILAAVVIIAINPARQFAQARNSQRQSNIETILNGIGQNLADNKGIFTCTGAALGTSVASSTITNGTPSGTEPTGLSTTKIDLSCLTPTYISNFPNDPDATKIASTYSGYEVSTDANGRVLVCAPFSNETVLGLSSALCIKR